ncbi:MAG: hypothetical protein AB1918_09830, partial [Pseudomonadota bacterium]
VVLHVPQETGSQVLSFRMASGFEDRARYIGLDGQNRERWMVEEGYLDKIQLKLKGNYSGTTAVDVDVIVTDINTAEGDGHSRMFAKTLSITADGVSDAPAVSLDASSSEDAHAADGIPMHLTITPRDLADGVETITKLTIDVDLAGVPDLDHSGLWLMFGTQRIDVTGGTEITLEGAQLDAFRAANGTITIDDIRLFGVDAHSSKDIPVSVRAWSLDPTDGGGAAAETPLSGAFRIVCDADAPDFAVATTAATVAAGTAVDLGVTFGLKDTDGSESGYFVVTGVASGMTLNAGWHAGEGIWIVPGTAVAGLSVGGVAGTSATLGITAVVLDRDDDGGTVDRWTSAEKTVSVSFTGTPGGDGGTTPAAPTVTATPVTVAEDPSGGFGIAVSASGSPDALIIRGPLQNLTLSSQEGGDGIGYYKVGNDYVVPMDKVAGLRFKPTADWSGETTITVGASASSGGRYATGWGAVEVDVTPVTDGPGFDFTVPSGADTTEDSPGFPVDITLSQTDDDRSEALAANPDGTATLTVTFRKGAAAFTDLEVSFGGAPLTGANGVYTLTLTADQVQQFRTGGSLTVSGLTIVPPAQFHGDIAMTASIGAYDSGLGTTLAPQTFTSATKLISVTAEADGPVIQVQDVANGVEDTAVDLGQYAFSVMTPDLLHAGNAYGSEYLAVVLEHVPAGAVVIGATNNGGDGQFNSWTIKSANVDWQTGKITGVSIVPPADFSGTMELRLAGYVMEASTKQKVADSETFEIEFAGRADTPTVNPQDVTGAEDLPVLVDLRAALADDSEVLSVVITDVPQGARFVYQGGGQQVTVSPDAQGTCTIPAAGLATGAALSFIGPANASGRIDMTVKAVAVENTTAESAPLGFSVTLAGVADAPELHLAQTTVTGVEDQGWQDHSAGIPLGISGTLDDSSETLTFTIEAKGDGAIPAGTILQPSTGAPIALVDGRFHVSAAQIDGIRMVPPQDWHGELALTVTATSSESDSESASVTADLTVTVAAAHDAPRLAIGGQNASSVEGALGTPLKVVPDASALTITDDDGNTTLDRVELVIEDAGAGDELNLSGMSLADLTAAGITATWNAAAHTLTLAGPASTAAFAAAAKAVVLTGPEGALAAGTRRVHINAYDQENPAAAGTIATTVTVGGTGAVVAVGSVAWGADGDGLADAPVLTVTGGDATTVSASATAPIHAVPEVGAVSLTDPDGTAAVARLEVVLDGALTGDTLGLAGAGIGFDPSGKLT